MFNQRHYVEKRHGGAGWQEVSGIIRAGLTTDSKGKLSVVLGHIRDRHGREHPVALDSDGSIVTVAGARGRKFTDQACQEVLLYRGSALVFDPKGEFSAVCLQNEARLGKAAYVVNPIAGGASADPLDVLQPDSPTLHGDAAMLAEAIFGSQGTHDAFWVETVRQWAYAFMVCDCEISGRTSLPRLKKVCDAITGNPEGFDVFARAMMESESSAVRRVAADVLTMRADGERVFQSLMAELHRHLAFMNDPNLQRSLENPTFSLRELTEGERPTTVYLVVPPEYLGIWAPFVRLFIETAMLYKQRRQEARRVLFLLDEAALLANGSWPGLERAFLVGQGLGIRTHAFFQDVGSMKKSLGPNAVQTLFASAQVRQAFAVRDIESARLFSQMLGEQTLTYANRLVATDAMHELRERSMRLLQGRAPLQTIREIEHQKMRAGELEYQARPLATPEEIMSMPEDRQLLFISGMGLGPIAAWKRPYFEDRRRLPGRWMPHPAFPPADRVKVPGRFGRRWVKVVTERVPREFARLPQYADGRHAFQFVKGYRP